MGKVYIYPSQMDGKHIEEHVASGTVGGWLASKYDAYKPGEKQPFALYIDGVHIQDSEWHSAAITDDTKLFYCAQGYVAAIIAVIVAIYAYTSMPSAPKQQATARGKNLATADAQANTAKLGEVIPEIAGRYRRFPDYLVPPHRYFQDLTEQYAEFLLCVGKGYYDIPDAKVKIGDTKLASLGSDADYTIYEPGADLSAETAAQWWHSAQEIGGSSLGTAGLKINATYTVPPEADSQSFIFSGFFVEIPDGAGEFSADWTSGFVARIENPKPYAVYNDSFLAVIQLPAGQDFTELQPYVGMVIEITGDNEGYYKIGTYTPYVASPLQLAEITLTYDNGDPVSALETGEKTMSIGYRNQLYLIVDTTAATIEVERLTDLGVTESAWNGFDYYESTTGSVTLYGGAIEGDWCGPFVACPESKTTATLEIDLFFPSGLVRYKKSGNIASTSVTVELQWREAGTADAWNSVTYEYAGQTPNQIGYTETVAISSACNPEVRVRRIGAESTSTRVSDSVEWYGMRALLYAPSSYDGVTVMAVRLRGDNRVAANSQNKINVECTRKLPIRSGGAWTANTATRSIAAFAAHVARDMGYVDAQMDMDELDRLDAIWNAREDYYDWVCDEDSVRDTINQCLRAGFAEMTVERGNIRFVRDEIRTIYEQMYTPQNMTDALKRKFSSQRPDDKDGVDVTYTDAETWTKKTIECRLPGDNGYRSQKTTLDGITDATRAWRIGMRLRRAMKYRRWAYEWKTELDAMCSRYLSFCAVADDVPGYGKSSMIISAVEESAGAMLTISEPVILTGDDIVAYRNQDGTLSGPYTATAGTTDYEVYAVDAPAPEFVDGNELPHALVGSTARWSYPVLIKSISPDDYETVSVKAVNYSEDVYADDDLIYGANADPLWDDVVLILDFNETAGTGTFECLRTGREFTSVGGIVTSTTQQDGGYNASLVGNGKYIYAATDSTFATEKEEFTIDFKIYYNTSADSFVVFDALKIGGDGTRTYSYVLYIVSGSLRLFSAGSYITLGTVPAGAYSTVRVNFAAGTNANNKYISAVIDGVANAPILRGWDVNAADVDAGGINIGVVANATGAATSASYLRKLRITRGLSRGVVDYDDSSSATPYSDQLIGFI